MSFRTSLNAVLLGLIIRNSALKAESSLLLNLIRRVKIYDVCFVWENQKRTKDIHEQTKPLAQQYQPKKKEEVKRV